MSREIHSFTRGQLQKAGVFDEWLRRTSNTDDGRPLWQIPDGTRFDNGVVVKDGMLKAMGRKNFGT
jgi:hypothetical protein